MPIGIIIQKGHIFGPKAMVGFINMLTDSRAIHVTVGEFDVAMVLMETGVHGTFGLTDVGGIAWVGVASGAWDVVHHRRLVGVEDGVFEVDKLGAERVLVARYDANIGFAECPAYHFRGAAVVW